MRRCYQNNAAQQLKSQVKIAATEDAALLLESQGVSTKGAKVNLGLNVMI